MSPLLPKLRGQFAEFLNYSSPERLSILYLTTSVGLGYGPNVHSLEAFLGSMSTPPSTQKSVYASRPKVTLRRDLPHRSLSPLTPRNPTTRRGCPPASPHHLATTDQAPRDRYHATTPEGEVDKKAPTGWLVSPAHHWARTLGYGNINPFTIDYACRPRLRSRLTLGRRT